MSADLNRVLLVGRLVRDPELKSTNSGSMFCRFTLASNWPNFKRDTDNKVDVGFFDCVAWGKVADIVAKYVNKGERIGIDGALRFSSWENSEGKKMSKVEIKVDNIQFLESKKQSADEPQESTSQSDMSMGATSDIPF